MTITIIIIIIIIIFYFLLVIYRRYWHQIIESEQTESESGSLISWPSWSFSNSATHYHVFGMDF